jgi:predicted transcriptional regulator YheO
MYKNPLNNGDISDYNSLKNQRDYKPMIDKYKKKLPIKPTELQKYYQYMTYQQPILDEANYVAERMKNENINKQKEDFYFIEDLKKKREEEMKKHSQSEEMIKKTRETLFEPQPKNDDITPTINTDLEIEMPQPRTVAALELFGDSGDNYPFDDLASIADTIPMIEDKKKTDFLKLSKIEKVPAKKQMINELYATGNYKTKSQLNLTKDELLKLYKNIKK